MKRITSFLALSALLVVGCAAFSQNGPIRGRYVVIPQHGGNAAAPAGTLATWNGSFTYQGVKTNFIMLGTDPSSNNTTTTVNVYIIPVNVCVTSGGTKTCFDPKTKQSNGASVTTNVLNSPIFQNQDYNQGGTDIGNTQYEDAFQRANFWTDVMTNTNYHVVMKPILIPEVTLNVPTADGSLAHNQFGVPETANVSLPYFDGQITAGLPKLKQITPTSLALVLTYDTYLTEGGCCIGGYHSANGNQTYSEFTYTTPSTGVSFSQDVSALSHELGEWYDDPLINNFLTQGGCAGGLLEVGDPIENENGTHQYGDFTYTLGGFTYHLQDLVNLKYFGQTPATANNNDWTFQGQTSINGVNFSVCSFGQ